MRAPATSFTELPEQDANASVRLPRAQGQHRRQGTLHHQLDEPFSRPDCDAGDQTVQEAQRRVTDRRILESIAQPRHLLAVELSQPATLSWTPFVGPLTPRA